MDNPKVLIIVILLIIAVVVILSMVHKKEGFGGGSGSYQHSYSGINSNNYNTEGFNECGPSVRYTAPPRKDKRTFGNSYNVYPYNGYYSDQSPEDKFLGCLNLCILNTGVEEKSYNECVNLCKDV